jgi:hypothetical protein
LQCIQNCIHRPKFYVFLSHLYKVAFHLWDEIISFYLIYVLISGWDATESNQWCVFYGNWGRHEGFSQGKEEIAMSPLRGLLAKTLGGGAVTGEEVMCP